MPPSRNRPRAPARCRTHRDSGSVIDERLRAIGMLLETPPVERPTSRQSTRSAQISTSSTGTIRVVVATAQPPVGMAGVVRARFIDCKLIERDDTQDRRGGQPGADRRRVHHQMVELRLVLAATIGGPWQAPASCSDAGSRALGKNEVWDGIPLLFLRGAGASRHEMRKRNP